MPPITKENETLSATSETASRRALPAALPGDAAIKHQPVALEVAVTVNGARLVEGSDKREPFSESTKTVLVFGSGGVIRLSSAVAPGQLLFVTNEKTKKEAVCQVVKSKNYRNVSGYVELEFTQPVVGFWGIRFPGDRLGPASQPAAPASAAVGSPATSGTPVVSRPVLSKVEALAVRATRNVVEAKPAAPAVVARDSEPKPSEAKFVAPAAPPTEVPAELKPQAPVVENPVTPEVSTTPVAPASPNPAFALNAAPVKPVAPSSSVSDSPRASDVTAFVLLPPLQPLASSNPEELDARRLPRVSEVKPVVFTAMDPPQAPIASDPETAALKQQTARLQEQLSSLLFIDAAPTKAEQKAPVAPVIDSTKFADPAAKVLKIAKTEQAPARVKPAKPAKIAAAPLKSSPDGEEMKIPAWLEPLARNATAPASTQEQIEREKAKRLAEHPKIEEIAAGRVAAVDEDKVFEVQAPTFGSQLPIDENENAGESGSKSSGKGLLIGAVAAGVLLLAGGGWWYMRQQSGGVHASTPVTATHAPALPVSAESLQPRSQGSAAMQTNSAMRTNAPLQTNSTAQSNPAPNPVNAASAGISAVPARDAQPTTNPANSDAAAVTSALVQPAPEQPKKPVLGQVHLAKPKVTKSEKALDGEDADPGIALNEGQPELNAETPGAGLAVGNKQPAAPAAPLAVGGDVKQAKLISSVPPVYPAIAKSQHVAGDVRIDALIEANGRVTTMKIVSGPTLLHQAAMDALRQWKYQPATLDGKPVPMHLTVTLQFRLQ